jgi:hypothetical protein
MSPDIWYWLASGALVVIFIVAVIDDRERGWFE